MSKSNATGNASRKYAQSLVKGNSKGGMSELMASVIETPSEKELANLFETYETSDPIVTLDEGQGLRGILIGEGPPVESASQGVDPKTGKEKPGNLLKTWVIETPTGIRVRVVGGHQLNSELHDAINRFVVLVKGSLSGTGRGSREVREWKVFVKPLDSEVTQ